MGCSSSTEKAAAAPMPAAAPAPAKGGPRRPAAKKQAGRRKAPAWVGKHFQVKLAGEWKDYDKEEDVFITRAFLVGQPNCRFTLRGNRYEYNFSKMVQVNLDSGKEREIRAPPGLRQPKSPLLPAGPMIVVVVRKGQPGTCIELSDPNNAGQKVKVAVPKNAKPGSKLAVPLPAKGESVEGVMKKQEGMSVGGKVALAGAGLVGVGAVAVGGIVLGDYLTGGDLGTEEMAADAVDAVVEAAEDAADAAPGIAEDVGEWAEGAYEDAADAVEDFADGPGEDIVDWFADAGDAIGDVVMDLF